MPVYFEYALKVSICLAVSFLFYTLLLKRMTYYTWNRYFLLTFSVLSFVVPFININVFVQDEEKIPVSFINEIPSIHSYQAMGESANMPATFLYWQILTAIFLLVSFILLVRLSIQLLSIKKIKAKSMLLIAGEENIYHISEPILPFSFLNSIFINTNNYRENGLQEIIDHERVHVQQKHTIDVLLTEVICIVNWYNPFVWMLKKAVRENLEFIADDAVLRNGFDKKNYQYLLLKVTGDLPSAIATSLRFSSLKNRILMMNKTKTSRLHLFKFLLLVPVIIFLLLAFRNSKEIQSNTEAKSESAETFTLSKLTYSIPDEKVKAIVTKEQEKCLLKPGGIFNLTLVSNEKNRLKNLLESNGYNNIKSDAITFLIDSSSIKKSFSVQVNINVGITPVSVARKRAGSINSREIALNNDDDLIEKANTKAKPSFIDQVQTQMIYSYLNPGKPASGC